MSKIETRNIRGTELRATKDFALEGVAAAYNTPSRDLGGFTETIAPGAFSKSLQDGDDVVCTHNHDPNRVLGRRKSGTLTVTDTPRGLAFRCQLDPTNSIHKDVYASVQRGDTSECSFAFRCPPGGDSWSTDGKQRTLRSVELMDVSAVTFPAYPTGTNVDARSSSYVVSAAERAQLWQASDAARRSVLARQGKTIAAQTDADLRRRAAAAGAIITADAVQERADNELRARMESAAGRVFFRSKSEKQLYPYEQASGGAPDVYPYQELASAVASQLGHNLIGANSSQAFTKDKDGGKHTFSYSRDSNGNHTFGNPQLGGHPAWLTDEDVS